MTISRNASTSQTSVALEADLYVVDVNGEVGSVFSRTDAERVAATYLATYRLAIVKVIPLAEFVADFADWAPETVERLLASI